VFFNQAVARTKNTGKRRHLQHAGRVIGVLVEKILDRDVD